MSLAKMSIAPNENSQQLRRALPRSAHSVRSPNMTSRRSLATTLVSILFSSASSLCGGEVLVDFSEDDLRHDWKSANDNIMGGKSRGEFEIKEDHLYFSGSIDTDGGGYASIRTNDRDWGIEDAVGISLKCKGDGRTYRMEVRTDAKWGRMPVTYAGEFETKKGEWIDIKIPFSNLNPTMFGEPVDDPLPSEFSKEKIKMFGLDEAFDEKNRKLDATKVKALGIKLYDKKDGDFEFSLKRVSVYGEAETKPAVESWTSNDNKTIDAIALRYSSQKKVVTFQLANGKTAEVPLIRLNEEGQKRVLELFSE